MKSVKTILIVLLSAVIGCLCLCGCDNKLGNMKYTEENGEITVTGYDDSTLVTELKIPDEINGMPVVKIDDFGVVNAESLTKISIGKNVREISSWAFTNNQSLKEFSVSQENTHFKAIDGVLFTYDPENGQTSELVCYPTAKGAEIDSKKEIRKYSSYVVPEGVTVIRSKAFYKNGYLTQVTLPQSLERIEEKAFHRASALEGITLPASLSYVGKDAFAYCGSEKFTEITIPASVAEIREYAFYNCTNLKKITVLRKEEGMILGKKWYPTDNGRNIKTLEISFAD